MQLTIAPLKVSDIPPEEEILRAAQDILDSIPSWKKGKTYFKVVKTCSRPKETEGGAPWHCRMSQHGREDATFDEFWKGLGENKAENEKEFIHDLKKVKLVKQLSPTASIWTLYYELTKPLSPRVFTVLQVVKLESDTPRKRGTIVSIPIDLSTEPDLASLEEKGVRAIYTSVERLQETDDGKVDWCMAVSTTVGGLFPDFLAQMSMNYKISEDVPCFIKWYRSLK